MSLKQVVAGTAGGMLVVVAMASALGVALGQPPISEPTRDAQVVALVWTGIPVGSHPGNGLDPGPPGNIDF